MALILFVADDKEKNNNYTFLFYFNQVGENTVRRISKFCYIGHYSLSQIRISDKWLFLKKKTIIQPIFNSRSWLPRSREFYPFLSPDVVLCKRSMYRNKLKLDIFFISIV